MRNNRPRTTDNGQRTTDGPKGPEPIGEVLARLFTARGWGRRQDRLHLERAWAEAAGPEYAAQTRVAGLRRNVLEVVVGNAVIFSTYQPPPTSTGCNQAGSATIYAFDMVKGTPASALKDSSGNNVSQLVIPNGGITSDLQVSGGNLVFNTSNTPNQPRAVGLNVGGNVQVRSWKKVR